MMIGCQICWGTFWGPVGTTREALNEKDDGPIFSESCELFVVVNFVKAPEKLLAPIDLNDPAVPVIFLISSRPQAPAAPLAPSAQARKGEVQNNNPQPSKEIL